ncbi:cell-envelope stress modulator CpxP [Yersinia massiliensis]|uniref:Periplasmic heavy metal sensor n=2 Tax=Yersinia TaxID=629 RepID=A0A2R4NVH6_9GAMM|nr:MULTISPECIES: cell-envelope stress modulator CpxP [Yersinia]HEC1648968.1 cell-envelope stress modulator CpxP [Yersinia enterocolitica]ATM88120.1 stress adaptor protein CpxP [Yersinia frederiksenii]AVX40140.1 stress adaptor protein CpxP [Yersinia massiliensis]MCB5318910.1 cell-envelope stress modulator CpxP [Yersinia massiliensis]MDA5548670.1 cell-envelope stress modulator CpxP [Yersinia massiliensis]
MRKVTKLTTLMMASMLVLGSSTAFAVDKADRDNGWCHGDGSMMNKKDGRGHHNMFDGVNLTEQQRQQMRDLMRQSRQGQPRMDIADREAMHKLMTADKFDEAAVRAQAEKMSKDQIERQVEMAKVRNQMYNLLTPEQKAALNQKHQQRIEKMQQAPAAQPSSAQK